MTRLRLAPSDRRTAISRCLAMARASMTFDTLAHAVTSTSTNAAKTGDRIASIESDIGLGDAWTVTWARASVARSITPVSAC